MTHLHDSLGNAADVNPYALSYQYAFSKENKLEINPNSNSNHY